MAKSFNLFILTLIGFGIFLTTGVLRPAEAQAWDLITGRVKTLVEVDGKIKLKVVTNSQLNKSQETASSDITDQETIDFEVPREELPPFLKEGDLIRIWQKSDNRLKSVRISYSRGYDPTGVRSRLSGRGRHSGGGRGGGKGGNGGH